jgi:predicted TIM-barrel fold metal-dependent hydrolase
MINEPILDPDLPIIDPHHHFWDLRTVIGSNRTTPSHVFEQVIAMTPRYLLDELLADMRSGHNVRATVFLECSQNYNQDAPADFRCVGETEFVNGIAAMSASGLYGDIRVCAGIVGKVDLRIGDAARAVLEAHMAAASTRFRGIRHSASFDADPAVLGPLARVPAGLYLSDEFRTGFRHLAPLGLSFDAWLLEPQLPDLIDLARAFPETTIVLDHVGTPLGIASYQGKLPERFPIWREHMQQLAKLDNVNVKIGGLAMPFCSFDSFLSEPEAPSTLLAEHWKPYVETTIELFGSKRCMFESNFPVDRGSCTYATLWNALKRLAAHCSKDEKTALFSGTAARVYRLALPANVLSQ